MIYIITLKIFTSFFSFLETVFIRVKSVFLPKASTSRTVQQVPKVKMTSNFHASLPSPKICDMSDVLSETITRTIYRTVRGQVKNHSPLTKQGKCWAVTAQIADHTSSVEVCFESEVYRTHIKF